MITRFAIWWLKRRGYPVLSYGFVGLVLGNCTAIRTSPLEITVVLPHKDAKIVALNHSIIITKDTR